MAGLGGNTYNMNHPNRGTFYLFNKNVQDIDDHLFNFKDSFKNLGFRISENRDRMNDVELFQKDVNETNFSSDGCVFFVALHYNNSTMDYNNYIQVFNDIENRQLRDKPKLFFFICQEKSGFEEFGRIEHDSVRSSDNVIRDFISVEIYSKNSKKTLKGFSEVFEGIRNSRPNINILLKQLEEHMEISKTVNKLSKELSF